MEYKLIDDTPIVGLRRVMANNMYGIIDNNGQLICDIVYDEISFYYPSSIENDRIPVKKDGKCGFMDKAGKIIINTRFDDYYFMRGTGFSENNNFITTFFQEKPCVIDRMGNILTQKYEPDYIQDVTNDRFVIMEKHKGDYYVETLIYDLVNECIPSFWKKITGVNGYALIIEALQNYSGIKIKTTKSDYEIDENGEIVDSENASFFSKVGRNMIISFMKFKKNK